MSISCTFLVHQEPYWLHMVVQVLSLIQDILPTYKHIPSMNIRLIFDGIACRRAASMACLELQLNRHIMCVLYLCSVRLASIAVGVHWSFSFRFENSNNSQVFRLLQARSLQNIAHKSSYDLCTQSPHLPLSSNHN
jgi:hypothetical protein